jgi:hypothetical protein
MSAMTDLTIKDTIIRLIATYDGMTVEHAVKHLTLTKADLLPPWRRVVNEVNLIFKEQHIALIYENERLRAALSVSKDPCIYCKLPAEDFNKCEFGFPGCSRADDILGCPHLGAALNAEINLKCAKEVAEKLGRMKALEEICSLMLPGADRAFVELLITQTQKDIIQLEGTQDDKADGNGYISQ